MLCSGTSCQVDKSLAGIEGAVGPFINLNPCRIRLDQDDTIERILARNDTAFVESLPHQSSGLEVADEMACAARRSSIFNTVFNFQKTSSEVLPGQNTTDGQSTLRLQLLDGRDPMEVSFSPVGN